MTLVIALIKEYANSYEDMTDAQADSLVKKMAMLDEQTCDLAPAVDSEIPRRCLLENRLRCSSNWTDASICCSICSLPQTFRLSNSVLQPLTELHIRRIAQSESNQYGSPSGEFSAFAGAPYCVMKRPH